MPLPTHCLCCQAPLVDEARAGIAISVMGDEVIYTYLFCAQCQHYTVEAYHDHFLGDDEVSLLPALDKAEGDAALALIRACPDPMNKNCDCASHRALYHGRPRS
ncbi:MAG: hypothetical protein ABIJ09_15015 [Pseudomonadota bacterium]